MPAIRFDVTRGPHEGHRFELGPPEEGAAWSLGRADDAAISLADDRFVSRHQAVVRVLDRTLTVLAWPGTTNPTLLNGRPLRPGVVAALADEDTIQVGRSELQCRFADPDMSRRGPRRTG